MWRPSCSHFTHCAPRFDSEPPESRAAAGRAGVSMTSRGRRRARTLRRCRPRVTPSYLCADYPRRHQPPLADTDRVHTHRHPPTPTGTHNPENYSRNVRIQRRPRVSHYYSCCSTPRRRHFPSICFAMKNHKTRSRNVLVAKFIRPITRKFTWLRREQ